MLTAKKPSQRHQSGQGGRPMPGKGQGAMMARVLIYLYIVLVGITFLLERPMDLIAIAP